MKKILNYTFMLVVLLVTSFAFTSCGDDESNVDAFISISNTNLSFMASGGSQQITIASNVQWSICGIPSWITVRPTSGMGEMTVAINANSYDKTETRTANLLVSGGGVNKTIYVSQGGQTSSVSIVGTWQWDTIYLILNKDLTWKQLLDFGYGDISETASGTYVYNETEKKLTLRYSSEITPWAVYEVIELSEKWLKLKDSEGKSYSYYRTTLPEKPDYSAVINRAWVNTTYNFEYITLMNGGQVDYKWLTNDLLAYYEIQYRGAKATGSYTLDGAILTINLGNVKVDAYGYDKDLWSFHGFDDGQSRTKKYTIHSCDGNTLVMEDEDKVECTYVRAEKYTPQIYGTDVSGTANGHDYVDLGLSVKWATTNLYAEAPQDFGTKLFSYAEAGSANDPVVKAWGGKWRLPTLDEVKELNTKCSIKGIYSNTEDYQDVSLGYIVTGPNGKTVYFPTEGSSGGNYYLIGTYKSDSEHWTMNLTSFYINYVALLNAYSKEPIRPVLAE